MKKLKKKAATQCPKCNTWRTPGESHVPNDVEAVPKSALYSGLCKG